MVKKKTVDDILRVEKCVSIFSKECGQLIDRLTVYHTEVVEGNSESSFTHQEELGQAVVAHPSTSTVIIASQNEQNIEPQLRQLPLIDGSPQPKEASESDGSPTKQASEGDGSPTKPPEGSPTKFYCTSCNVTFTSAVEHRLHSKMDWHRFNVKQKSSSKPILSEELFESMLGDDCSRISGSDSDSDFENMHVKGV